MTVSVVIASYTMTPTTSDPGLIPGALLIVGVGLVVGVGNAIPHPRLPSPLDHCHTRHVSILEGAALLLRDHPEGSISSDVIDSPDDECRLRAVAFIGVVVLAVLADVWLYRTRTGLAFRAVGLDETASRRIGMGDHPHGDPRLRRLLVMASIAAFYLAAEVQIGSPIIGNQALESIAAAVLGGASLAGGKGSFVGTLLAAFFLSLIDNVLPLFQAPTEYAEMTIAC